MPNDQFQFDETLSTLWAKIKDLTAELRDVQIAHDHLISAAAYDERNLRSDLAAARAEDARLREENARMEIELAEAQRDKDLAEFHAREMNEACGKLELERDDAIARAQSAEAEVDRLTKERDSSAACCDSYAEENQRLYDRAQSAEAALAEMREAALKTEIALENLHALVWGECPSLLNEDSGGSAHLDIACRDALNALRALMEKGGDNGDGNA